MMRDPVILFVAGALCGVLAAISVQGVWPEFWAEIRIGVPDAVRWLIAEVNSWLPPDPPLTPETELEANRRRQLGLIASDWKVINGGKR